ncbi:hypothetical protein ASPWEDRAFT_49873 [Aspergillus wentii DTO 134E9]|uniref:Oleate hydratase n=1 Tax=Aspergillus wentii DTO 134E9 TaxID=1073089 RepID=A0A1L9RNE1_ASPWE|nr:uncharacterized protein ASPWEDRAFT_49873 [Aspergillus wentii DTO 134E9]OJJ36348.1 hypothetical protein ASPWEDRAFT_49873 [Aspergillus wentii DTO 134E9]
MTRKKKSIPIHANRRPIDINAWILGSSIASLASAVHLIAEANVPAPQIHILESRNTPGDGITTIGDWVNGYDLRPGCLPNFHTGCMEKLLALVPSANVAGSTLLNEIEEFRHRKTNDDAPATHILTKGEKGIKRMETTGLGLNLRDRMKVMMLMLRSEEGLARRRIDQFFSKYFFEKFKNLNVRKPLDCTQFNQFEWIVRPIIRFLQNQGVDFRLCTKVTDIVSRSDRDVQTISAIHVSIDSFEEKITLLPDDIVIASLGSVTSGSLSGTNDRPPVRESMTAESDLCENWSLWLTLGTKYPNFGDPYNFCTRVAESRLGAFTVTLRDPEFFERFAVLTRDKPGTGNLVSLKDSNWKINVCLLRQPFFTDQPEDIQIFWGYCLCPEREGQFVRKPMLYCSGQEIIAELLWHLEFPSKSILKNSTTIPCVMPRRTTSLLPRIRGDRPKVIPENMANLAVIGQFAEIPDWTTASMDYGVLGAQLASKGQIL